MDSKDLLVSVTTPDSNCQKVSSAWAPVSKPKIFEKLQRESLDPAIIFPPEIVELIFKNICGWDLIESVSLVSPTWNHHLTTSTRCMDKILFKMNLRKFGSSYRSNLLKGTMRTYQHISIKGCFLANLTRNTIDAFSAVKGSWKSVSIEKIIFPDVSSLIETFDIFEESVETVSLKYVKVDSVHDVESLEYCWFDRLTSLTINESDMLITSAFLACSTLKSFDFIGEEEDEVTDSIIKNQKHLRYLAIN